VDAFAFETSSSARHWQRSTTPSGRTSSRRGGRRGPSVRPEACAPSRCSARDETCVATTHPWGIRVEIVPLHAGPSPRRGARRRTPDHDTPDARLPVGRRGPAGPTRRRELVQTGHVETGGSRQPEEPPRNVPFAAPGASSYEANSTKNEPPAGLHRQTIPRRGPEPTRPSHTIGTANLHLYPGAMAPKLERTAGRKVTLAKRLELVETAARRPSTSSRCCRGRWPTRIAPSASEGSRSRRRSSSVPYGVPAVSRGTATRRPARHALVRIAKVGTRLIVGAPAASRRAGRPARNAAELRSCSSTKSSHVTDGYSMAGRIPRAARGQRPALEAAGDGLLGSGTNLVGRHPLGQLLRM